MTTPYDPNPELGCRRLPRGIVLEAGAAALDGRTTPGLAGNAAAQQTRTRTSP